MKSLLLALAATVALASPAAAQEVRLFGEATATANQIRDFPNDTTFGGRVGIQSPLAPGLTTTVDVGYDTDETLNANIGLEPRIRGPLSLYGQVGVLRNSGEWGYRVGTGVKLDLTRNAYLRAGYQRDDYGANASNAGTVGLGLRF
jgi:opacity protein-like surface antigen